MSKPGMLLVGGKFDGEVLEEAFDVDDLPAIIVLNCDKQGKPVLVKGSRDVMSLNQEEFQQERFYYRLCFRKVNDYGLLLLFYFMESDSGPSVKARIDTFLDNRPELRSWRDVVPVTTHTTGA